MAIGYLTPDGVNPYHPLKTTNAKDVFAPNGAPEDAAPEEEEIESAPNAAPVPENKTNPLRVVPLREYGD